MDEPLRYRIVSANAGARELLEAFGIAPGDVLHMPNGWPERMDEAGLHPVIHERHRTLHPNVGGVLRASMEGGDTSVTLEELSGEVVL
jgi:hypothetical protein